MATAFCEDWLITQAKTFYDITSENYKTKCARICLYTKLWRRRFSERKKEIFMYLAVVVLLGCGCVALLYGWIGYADY